MAVRQMFNSIAPRYDLLNHGLLSANVDRLWWRKAARRFAEVLARPDSAVLDICCGTGDLTMALLKLRPRGAWPILAGDFAPAMLRRGAEKFGPKRLHGSENESANSAPYAIAIEADALQLPLRAESLDLIVTAFGFRNLANYEAGLMEFYRALKPWEGSWEFWSSASLEGSWGRLTACTSGACCPRLGARSAGRMGRITTCRRQWEISRDPTRWCR